MIMKQPHWEKSVLFCVTSWKPLWQNMTFEDDFPTVLTREKSHNVDRLFMGENNSYFIHFPTGKYPRNVNLKRFPQNKWNVSNPCWLCPWFSWCFPCCKLRLHDRNISVFSLCFIHPFLLQNVGWTHDFFWIFHKYNIGCLKDYVQVFFLSNSLRKCLGEHRFSPGFSSNQNLVL